MKIGIIGPIWYNIPPDKYGGTESVVYHLVNGLVERGHDVTLFGPATAQVKARLHATTKKPTFELGMDWNNNIASQMYHITEAFDRGDEFDILHMHLNKSHDYISLPLSIYSKIPVMFTLHFPIPLSQDVHTVGKHSYNREDRLLMLEKYSMLPFTSISSAQQKPLAMNFVKTIYNSLEIDEYHFNASSDNYFVWLGRVQAIKGTKEAIVAAKNANVQLKLLGALDRTTSENMEYYEREVQPLVDGKQIQWLGEADMKLKNEIVGKAKALLNPIQWEEPFGLVMAEAQAMGTPVITLNRGAASELVEDGVTGFVAKSMDEFTTKIARVDTINRKDARDRAEKLFGRETMITGYEEAYGTVQTRWEEYQKKQIEWLRSWKVQNRMIE